MKNVIKVIAVSQIVLAFVFVYYASQIDPGLAKISKQFAESCGKAEQIVNSHKEIYEKSATNIMNLQSSRVGAGDKTRITSGNLITWGKWLKTPPEGKIKKILWPVKSADKMGTSIEKMGSQLNDISVALHKQADILKEYEQNILPQSREGFDSTANSLRETQIFLNNLEQKSQSNVKTVSYIAGIIFLLNGVSLLIIAFVMPSGYIKES